MTKKALILCALLTLMTWQAAKTQTFKTIKQLPTTSVKNQWRSGTCWSFGTLSFIESELLRMKKGEFDLSEMFIVYNIYPQKAVMHVRMQGNSFFTYGGQAHDVMKVIEQHGFMPEEAYSGLKETATNHNHALLDTAAKDFIKTIYLKKGSEMPQNWLSDFTKIVEKHLGTPPQTFNYKGKKTTPKEFAKSLNFDPKNYVEITSFTHHPFYEEFCLESRFNWAMADYYNIPLAELMQTIDYAIDKGYTVVFNGDVSEPDFDFETGVAEVPQTNISQELRQEMFDNNATTVDHLMHIIGTAKAENGKLYYITKNSWGQNVFGGNIYLSSDYVKLKAVSILIHKEAIPAKIVAKMNFRN